MSTVTIIGRYKLRNGSTKDFSLPIDKSSSGEEIEEIIVKHVIESVTGKPPSMITILDDMPRGERPKKFGPTLRELKNDSEIESIQYEIDGLIHHI